MSAHRRGRDGRRSSRGHVRVERGHDWFRLAGVMAAVVALVITGIVLVTRFVIPAMDEEQTKTENRTWLEFEWTRLPVNQSAVNQLAQRLKDNAITRVYLEANAWQADGAVIEGAYAGEFVTALKTAYPDLTVLLWLRMSGEEISQADRRAAAIALAGRAVREWQFDGVQLNARAVYKGSESYVQLVRDLRETIGETRLLSLTVPPDRIPTNPDVPIGTTLNADLTWDINYKQRVGLLEVDEMVIMAHASGLQDSGQYKVWVSYQVTSYIEALRELEDQPEFVVALPTYDGEPEHNPAVETIPAAVAGVRQGMDQAGAARKLIKGVGLYEYKTTDSLEWALYAENWLNKKTK